MPPGASTSCAVARTWSPARSSVPDHHAIDIRLGRQQLQIGSLDREPRGRRARSHDQRADAGQRGRDRVGQAEGEEVGFGIRAQHAERQHHDARQRPRDRAGCRRRRCTAARAAPRRSRRPTRIGRPGRLASARRITRSTAAIAGEPVSAGGCSCTVACRTSTIVAPPKAGRPASISNRIAPAEKRSERASTGRPPPARAPCSAACRSPCRCASAPRPRRSGRRAHGAPARSRAA